MSPPRFLTLLSSLFLLSAAVAAHAGPPATGVSAATLEGADFDFVLANLAKDSAYVKYGAVRLLAGGKTELKLWTGNQREPIPRQLDSGPLSPVVDVPAGPAFHDKGVKILSTPSTFRGGARHAAGTW